jgi:type VI secretion system protein ImpH
VTERFADLLAAPEEHDFLLVMRRLEQAFSHLPRLGRSAARREEYVRLGQNPSFAFPASTIDGATLDSDGTLALFVCFLGLTGSQGPLPLTLTQEAYDYAREGDDALARFLDLFNNRFLQLFFRAWADARPIAQHDRPQDDRFEDYVAAPIGLAGASYRGLDSVPDMAKSGFTGLMAPAAKSASRLRAVISALFGLRVEIEEFVGMRLTLEPADYTRLGVANMQLSADAMLGASVYSVQDKFSLRLYTETLAHYERFLPTGDLAEPLADIVHFYAGMALEYDVELALPAREAPGIRLGESGRLGWTSWLAPEWSDREDWLTDAHFNLARRFAERRRSA